MRGDLLNDAGNARASAVLDIRAEEFHIGIPASLKQRLDALHVLRRRIHTRAATGATDAGPGAGRALRQSRREVHVDAANCRNQRHTRRKAECRLASLEGFCGS